MQPIRKILIITLGIIVLLAFLMVAFASQFTKYYIEKHDENILGHKITIDLPYINPFTGYFHFRNVKLYEVNSDSLLFSAKSVTINLTLYKLLLKNYEITEFTIIHPIAEIVYDGSSFNFSDLVEKVEFKKSRMDTVGSIPFSLLNFNIHDGELQFYDTLTPARISFKEINIKSAGKHKDSDSVSIDFSLVQGDNKGDIKGSSTINLMSKKFRSEMTVHQFDLNIIDQYLKELTSYSFFTAQLDANFHTSGNIDNMDENISSGVMIISELRFGANEADSVIAFEKLKVAIHELNPQRSVYLFDSISLSLPYFKFIKYDSLDNVQNMFGIDGSNILAVRNKAGKFNLVLELYDYAVEFAKRMLQGYYKINRMGIYKGEIQLHDYSINEKFSLELSPIFLISDSISKNNEWVKIAIYSKIKPYGALTVDLRVNPNDSSDFDMSYNIKNMSAAMWNPYMISYTSFPFNRGTIEAEGKWKVRDGEIQSNNRLSVYDSHLTNRIRNKNTKWIPMRFILELVRKKGNVIDFEIPISGNIDDPKQNIGNVIMDILGNIFLKPATAPYTAKIKKVETKIDRYLVMNWEMRQSNLDKNHLEFIKLLTKFLNSNPEARVVITPNYYSDKEKEYILLFEAKKKYFMTTHKPDNKILDEKDSLAVEQMSIKDPEFIAFLNSRVKDSLVFTVQEKSLRLIGEKSVNSKLKQLIKARENNFLNGFKDEQVLKQITISKGKSVIPYNGFSYFQIDYKNEFPIELIKAYNRLQQLEKVPGRRKHK